MENSDLLTKLAAEIPADESKQSKSETNKSNTAKKGSDKKPFPPKGMGNKPVKQDNESKDKNKKPDNTEGKEQNKEQNNKGNFGENKPQNNGEKEITGNEPAEEAASTGTSAIDPKMIFDFFQQNPTPTDEMFHEFAESKGYDIPQAEAAAYILAGKYIQFLRGGKSQGLDPNTVDPQQLEMGIEVEAEHSEDPATRKKIALDHLAEKADYYTMLQKVEGGDEGQAVTPDNEENQNNNKSPNDTPAKGQQVDVHGEGSIRS